MRKIAGWLMLLTPFAALFVGVVMASGFWAALSLFGAVAAVTVWMILAVKLTADCGDNDA